MARPTKNKLYVQDVTLRDGMHAIRHQYHLESVKAIARALDRSKVDSIEICHGDGLTGATFNYGFGAHDDGEWISAVAEECQHAVVAILLIPGIATVHDLKAAYKAGARSVRIATHCTEADVSRQHIEAARKLGMDTVGFLMMAHMAPIEKLVEQAKLMESYGAECVYVTDSAGALLPNQYADRVKAFRQALGKKRIKSQTRRSIFLQPRARIAFRKQGDLNFRGCLPVRGNLQHGGTAQAAVGE